MFSLKECPGAATVASDAQAPLESRAGRTWPRHSVPCTRTLPSPLRVHTHHCPTPLLAIFPLDLLSIRQTGGSGSHSYHPSYGEFCQGPMARRWPTGNSRTLTPPPHSPPPTKSAGNPSPGHGAQCICSNFLRNMKKIQQNSSVFFEQGRVTSTGPSPDARHLRQTVNVPPIIRMIPHVQLSGTRELRLPHEDLGF